MLSTLILHGSIRVRYLLVNALLIEHWSVAYRLLTTCLEHRNSQRPRWAYSDDPMD